MSLPNKVQLITYGDSLGGNLKNLNALLESDLKDLFPGGVHLLPPFPSSGDRGFAPINYLEIDPGLGTWEEIRAIGEKGPVVLDLMVNHISQKSIYFQDFLQNGNQSEWADIFLTPDRIWDNGAIPQADFDKIYLRRSLPYSDFTIQKTGEQLRIWTTFGATSPSEQIDLDVNSPKTRELFETIFDCFAKNGTQIVRLDAVGYVIKKPGTSCFFVEPEIYDFLEWVNEMAKKRNIELLPEVHAHHQIQWKLAGHGYWIYDFILPYLVLSTLINKDANQLIKYINERPEKQFTMLDCHDGIPVMPDMDDIVDSVSARRICDICEDRGALFTRVESREHCAEDGFDVHQICGTFYSLLGSDDDAYIIARAIQLFVPGIPQIYYVGLLACENDQAGVDKTSEIRELNRENFSLQAVREKMGRPVVQRLMRLIKLRNDHPAFEGTFTNISTQDHDLDLKWDSTEGSIELKIDLNSYRALVQTVQADGSRADFVL
jgi:sucrose phosphorylase